MNTLAWMLLMTVTIGPPDDNDSQQSKNQNAGKNQAVDIEPDAELLLFLAEWNEQMDGQWIEPDAFTGDNALSEELAKQTTEQNNEKPEKKSDESKPDNS